MTVQITSARQFHCAHHSVRNWFLYHAAWLPTTAGRIGRAFATLRYERRCRQTVVSQCSLVEALGINVRHNIGESSSSRRPGHFLSSVEPR
jgi:hypothetical protein